MGKNNHFAGVQAGTIVPGLRGPRICKTGRVRTFGSKNSKSQRAAGANPGLTAHVCERTGEGGGGQDSPNDCPGDSQRLSCDTQTMEVRPSSYLIPLPAVLRDSFPSVISGYPEWVGGP